MKALSNKIHEELSVSCFNAILDKIMELGMAPMINKNPFKVRV